MDPIQFSGIFHSYLFPITTSFVYYLLFPFTLFFLVHSKTFSATTHSHSHSHWDRRLLIFILFHSPSERGPHWKWNDVVRWSERARERKTTVLSVARFEIQISEKRHTLHNPTTTHSNQNNPLSLIITLNSVSVSLSNIIHFIIAPFSFYSLLLTQPNTKLLLSLFI